ncbi:hypothetical protein DFH28DRAFT_927318 [Melampsora americana]|nr:hypothetical protein DFH28DRAFT_927318 [Melampsora americana]
MGMDLSNSFWDEVALNQQDEPWAICQSTKDGIVALCNQLACEEKLQQLGQEARQLLGKARVAEWNSVYRGLSKQACCLWRRWDQHLVKVIPRTEEYVEVSEEADPNMIRGWQQMVAHTFVTWQEVLGVPVFWEHEEEDGPIRGMGDEDKLFRELMEEAAAWYAQ